ncbi:hypothetical protein [Streptomyces umbrinus]|uniref:hypothetical protein n=1 Tax=Streptomyces umbrinus TaxID=67370 RepID=UPI0033E21C47
MFHQASRTWGTYIGALDVRALTVLQRLYGAAQRFGTEVRIQVIAAPATAAAEPAPLRTTA